MGDDQDPRISRGTVLFLIFTVFILAVSFYFLLSISGIDLLGRRLQGRQKETRTEEEIISEHIEEENIETTSQENEQNVAPFSSSEDEYRFLTICAIGSVDVSDNVLDAAHSQDLEYSFQDMISEISAKMSAADVSMATLSTQTAEFLSYDEQNAPVSLLDAIKSAGIHILNLATPNLLDHGYDGIQQTKAEIISRGFLYLGILDSGSDLTGIPMLTVDGVRVAVLGYTEAISEAGRAATVDGDTDLVPMLTEETVLSDIAKARADGAEIIIVIPFWDEQENTGEEIQIPAETQEFVYDMAERGADIILGNLESGPQQAEVISVERSDGIRHDVLVCYSLGELLSEFTEPERSGSMMVTIQLGYSKESRMIEFSQIDIEPMLLVGLSPIGDSPMKLVNCKDEDVLSSLSVLQRQHAREVRTRIDELTIELEEFE